LIWQRLSPVWQLCIEEAWQAYCQGSLPHGAVMTDAEGKIVARGRNSIREVGPDGRVSVRNRLAHAELNALLTLDWRAVDIYQCTLYSLIEPCAMCVGAATMAHIKAVFFAVRDGGAGASSLTEAYTTHIPLFKQGVLPVTGPEDSELETLLMALQVEATLSQRHPKPDEWIALLARDVPQGATLGEKLFATGYLQRWKEERRTASFVLDQLHEQLI
jgi:tRNA(adenine34) deaminase